MWQGFRDLQALKGLWAPGAIPENCNRGLQPHVAPPNLPALHCFKAPYKANNAAGFTNGPGALLLPREVFSIINDNYNGYCGTKTICPITANIAEFWQGVEDSPLFLNHALKTMPNFRTHCIPARLHVGSVPVTGVGKTWAKSLELASWGPLLGRGTTVLASYIIWTVWGGMKCQSMAGHTIKMYWRQLCWSLLCLYKGGWPYAGADGNMYAPNTPEGGRAGASLANGLAMCVCVFTADLDYYSQELLLPNHNSGAPCIFPCNSRAIPWTYHRGEALWVGRLWATAAWGAPPFP